MRSFAFAFAGAVFVAMLGWGFWSLKPFQAESSAPPVADPGTARPTSSRWEKIEDDLQQGQWESLEKTIAETQDLVEKIKWMVKATDQVASLRTQSEKILQITLPFAEQAAKNGNGARELVLLSRIWGRLDLSSQQKNIEHTLQSFRKELVQESAPLIFSGTRPYPQAYRAQAERRLKSGQPQDIQHLTYLLSQMADNALVQKLDRRLFDSMPHLPERSKLIAGKYLSVRMVSQQLDPQLTASFKKFLQKQKSRPEWNEINALVGALDAP